MTLVSIVFIICVAFFGEAVFGFGGGLISVPLLSLIIGVKASVTLVLIFQLLLGLLILHTYKITNWKVIRPALVALVIGSMLGTLSLSYFDDHMLRIILAVAILTYLVKQLVIGDRKFGIHRPKLSGFIGGGVGGWFQGVIGTGGPPFVIYLNEMSLSNEVFRACIIMMLFVCNLTRLGTSVSSDLFTPEILSYAFYTLPFFLVALWVGYRLHFKVSQRIYQVGIYTVLSLSAISLVYQYFSAS